VVKVDKFPMVIGGGKKTFVSREEKKMSLVVGAVLVHPIIDAV
jgi:hypothetical protein